MSDIPLFLVYGSAKIYYKLWWQLEIGGIRERFYENVITVHDMMRDQETFNIRRRYADRWEQIDRDGA